MDAYGQTTVMVTHDPRAAASADRVLFLADGLVVRGPGRSPTESRDRSRAMKEVHPMTRVALKGMAAAPAAHRR